MFSFFCKAIFCFAYHLSILQLSVKPSYFPITTAVFLKAVSFTAKGTSETSPPRTHLAGALPGSILQLASVRQAAPIGANCRLPPLGQTEMTI